MDTTGGRVSLSWTVAGVLIPCEDRPSEVCRRTFTRDTPAGRFASRTGTVCDIDPVV